MPTTTLNPIGLTRPEGGIHRRFDATRGFRVPQLWGQRNADRRRSATSLPLLRQFLWRGDAHLSRCGHYNEQGVRHCSDCGARLVRDCPACGAVNWVLADHCVQCGRNLDLIDQMTRRWKLTTQERLAERRSTMSTLKEQEERASQERMATLLEAERIRQEALALARSSQHERDRRIYVCVGHRHPDLCLHRGPGAPVDIVGGLTNLGRPAPDRGLTRTAQLLRLKPAKCVAPDG